MSLNGQCHGARPQVLLLLKNWQEYYDEIYVNKLIDMLINYSTVLS